MEIEMDRRKFLTSSLITSLIAVITPKLFAESNSSNLKEDSITQLQQQAERKFYRFQQKQQAERKAARMFWYFYSSCLPTELSRPNDAKFSVSIYYKAEGQDLPPREYDYKAYRIEMNDKVIKNRYRKISTEKEKIIAG